MVTRSIASRDSQHNHILEQPPQDVAREAIFGLVSWTSKFNGLCPVCNAAIMIAPREDCLCNVCESLWCQLDRLAPQNEWSDGRHIGTGAGYYTSEFGLDDSVWHPFYPATLAIENAVFDRRPSLDDLKSIVGDVYEWSFAAERIWKVMDQLSAGKWGWNADEHPQYVKDDAWWLFRLNACEHPIRWLVNQDQSRETVEFAWLLWDYAAAEIVRSPRTEADHFLVPPPLGWGWLDRTTTTLLRWMPYPRYLNTNHWLDVRERALERAGYRCQVCNTANSLHVHHRTYERRGAELPEDLIVLCRACHETFHKNGRLAR